MQSNREPYHQIDDELRLANLLEMLEGSSGIDKDIDLILAQIFGVGCDDFSGDAVASRKLVEHVLPNSRLQVGYDVTGVLPNAVLHEGGQCFSIVASTVPLAILRALIEALIERERQ